MKKVLILLVIIFITSGCSATYELTINNNDIKENLTIIENNVELFDRVNDSGWTLRESYEAMVSQDMFSKELYKVKLIDEVDKLGLEYKTDSLKSVYNSSVLNQCYTDFSVINENGIITIDTGKNFECYDFYENLENIKIVFKTNHIVEQTNSHEKNGNSYIWNFDKDKDKQIIISYFENKTKDSILPYILLSTFVIIIIGFIIYLKKKNNKENKI